MSFNKQFIIFLIKYYRNLINALHYKHTPILREGSFVLREGSYLIKEGSSVLREGSSVLRENLPLINECSQRKNEKKHLNINRILFKDENIYWSESSNFQANVKLYKINLKNKITKRLIK